MRGPKDVQDALVVNRDEAEAAWKALAESLVRDADPFLQPTLFTVEAFGEGHAIPDVPLPLVRALLTASTWDCACLVMEAWVMKVKKGEPLPKGQVRDQPKATDGVQVYIYWPGEKPSIWSALVEQRQVVAGSWFRVTEGKSRWPIVSPMRGQQEEHH